VNDNIRCRMRKHSYVGRDENVSVTSSSATYSKIILNISLNPISYHSKRLNSINCFTLCMETVQMLLLHVLVLILRDDHNQSYNQYPSCSCGIYGYV